LIFQQFRYEGGHLSYLIGDEKTQECVIIDPAIDIKPYIEAIEGKGLKLIYIIDTHSQADHVTGAGKLSEKTGGLVVMNDSVDMQRILSEGKGDEIGLGDILRENASINVDKKVKEGDKIEIGDIALRVIATPGHTQDSMLLLTNGKAFTGDTLMIGVCGRTDLPGGDTIMLYNSLFRKIYNLSDDIVVYPAHDYRGNINSVIGYEKVNNPFLEPRELQEFIEFIRKTFPPPTGAGMQCGAMKTTLSTGPAPKTGPLMNQMCIALEHILEEYPDDWQKWNILDVKELKKELDAGNKPFILDVREPDEFASGHIEGAVNIPVKELPQRIDELPDDEDTEVVTYCESGYRSSHATIFLKAYGRKNVKNLEHGIHEWKEEGYEVEK
jgi:glyoxylase-like metal-dependent hydrolase (beta-lactamase superfamily II)/rhodanese-related sulfurtransferase